MDSLRYVDGHFVPNVTFGFTLLKTVERLQIKIIDVI